MEQGTIFRIKGTPIGNKEKLMKKRLDKIKLMFGWLYVYFFLGFIILRKLTAEWGFVMVYSCTAFLFLIFSPFFLLYLSYCLWKKWLERWKIWKRREEAPFCGVDRHKQAILQSGWRCTGV